MNPIQRIRNFYHEVITELKKCTWPSRSELMESTLLVIVSIIILGIFVAVVDQVTQYFIDLIAS